MRTLTITLTLIIIQAFVVYGQENPALKKTFDLIFSKEEYRKALTILNEFIYKDTTNSDAYWQRAICFRRMGNYDKAENDLKHAIRLNNNDAKIFCELGTMYAMTERYTQALESYNKSVSIDSTYAPAYNSRGALNYYFMNNSEKALDLSLIHI